MDTYEEAKYKAKVAKESSENALKDHKIIATMIDNSPSPEQKKKLLKVHLLCFVSIIIPIPAIYYIII